MTNNRNKGESIIIVTEKLDNIEKDGNFGLDTRPSMLLTLRLVKKVNK
jgi:hypothetical protein